MNKAVLKLSKIQSEIKAPKNKFNSFGKYNYRNAEGILEAFKPFIEMHKVSLVVTDDVKQVGDRYYIEATATLYCTEEGEFVSAKALARESADKKGMDDSQITGTASSYARKYALNGLFLLDDTKDADSDEAKIEADSKAKTDPKNVKVSRAHIATIKSEMKRTGTTMENFLKAMNVQKIEDMTMDLFNVAMKRFENTSSKQISCDEHENSGDRD